MAKKIEKKKDAKTDAKKIATAPKQSQPQSTDVPKVVKAVIEESTITGEFREFRSGSKGWYLGGKVYINGTKCQVSCSIVIVGSKPEKTEAKAKK